MGRSAWAGDKERVRARTGIRDRGGQGGWGRVGIEARTVAVEDVEGVDRHGCDGARSPVSGISRLAWDVVRTMAMFVWGGSSRAAMWRPGAGRAPGQVPRYRDYRDQGTPPAMPPATATATHTHTPHAVIPIPRWSAAARTAHQSTASIGACPGPSSCISRDLTGLALSPIGPGYARGKAAACLGARIPACLWLRWPSLRPSSPRGPDKKKGSRSAVQV